MNCNTITYRHNEHARDRNYPLTIQLQSSTGVKQLEKMFLKNYEIYAHPAKRIISKNTKKIQKTQNSQTKSQKSQNVGCESTGIYLTCIIPKLILQFQLWLQAIFS